jgi:hypothetical protein
MGAEIVSLDDRRALRRRQHERIAGMIEDIVRERGVPRDAAELAREVRERIEGDPTFPGAA